MKTSALVLTFIAVTTLSGCSTPNTTSLKPTTLRCEYRVNPAGIDETRPRLSWIVEAVQPQARGLKQTAYRIIASSSREKLVAGTADLWDSGRVAGGSTTQITWRGKTLGSRAEVYWRVMVWDETRRGSAWSEPAYFTMGLLSAADWQGKWIGKEETIELPKPTKDKQQDQELEIQALRLPARMARKEFQITKPVRRAVAYVSGMGLFELHVNGRKAGDHVLSPNLTQYDKRVFYVTHDVTALLQEGPNAVGLLLGNGRWWAPRLRQPVPMVMYGTPRAIAQIDIEHTDGSRTVVATDETWRVTDAGPIRTNNEFDGEEYDATLEMPAWAMTGFDDSKWQPPVPVKPPDGKLVAQMAEPLKVIETLKPKSVKEMRPGLFIADMGQNMVGWCRLKVRGPQGTTVQLRFAETLQPDGTLYTANLRSALVTDRYTLKGTKSVEMWEPRFTYHGFRFVEITGFPGRPTPESIEGRVVHDAMTPIHDFTSSNDLLNRIHRNIVWGIKGNYRSIPTDCPQRDERQGWLGDRSMVSRSEAYIHDVAAFYSKWEQDIEDSQRPAGSVPDVAPSYWQFYNDSVTWPGTFLLVPGMLYEYYGDTRAIERHYPAMKKWVMYMRGFLKDGLIGKDSYGDWCVPPEDPKLIHSKDPARVTDKTLIASAYFIHLERQMARYGRLIGKGEEAAEFEDHAAKMQAAFQRRFYNAERGLYDNGTQTSSVLPLSFGLTPEGERAKVFGNLVTRIGSESKNHIGVGLIGAQWLMRALSDNGRADLAYTMATQTMYPGWGYMISKGATTIWELWNGDTADPAMNSGNHVMQIGDLGIWLYAYLAGIRPDIEKPGFAHVVLKPVMPGDLTFVRASHASPRGRIESHWRKNGARVEWDVTVPPNSTATIYVPARSGNDVTESGASAAKAQGLRFSRMETGSAVFEAVSGRYRFQSVAEQ